MKSNQFGPTLCGEILYEKIHTNKHLLRKIANFFEVTMVDFNLIIREVIPYGQRSRIRSVYLLGRFKQLDEFAKTNNLDEDIIKRLKYIIRFQTRV